MDNVALFQSFFESKDRITVIRDFIANEDDVVGTIQVDTAKGPAEFRVEIPDSFPFHSFRKSIGFFCLSGDGYSHLNADGSVCIIPKQMTDFKQKLEEEFSLFIAWVEKYYVREEKDERYEYPVVHLPRVGQRERLLYTNVERKFQAGQLGEFSFVKTNGLPSGLKSVEDIYVTSFSNTRGSWAKSIHSLVQKKGLWVFLDREPFIYRSKIATSWKELSPLLPQVFLRELAHRKAVYNGLRGIGATDFLFVMIGYHIPSGEVHWLAARIPLVNIPVTGMHSEDGFIGEFTEQEIMWCYTNNSSPDRFFGRGGFSATITEGKILIIGAGAIGSSLATTLTRGGARDITIMDGEHVEPGNICRSSFSSNDNYALKCVALGYQLIKISPFLEVNCPVVNSECAMILSKSLTPDAVERTREQLDKFDWIFDCTADNELCCVLDTISPRGIVVNFSVTDGAKEFVCVTGRNICKQKEILFEQFHQKEATYYEGTGCWNPTFQASYFDINAGLQLALKNIDHKERNGRTQRTFYIRAEENDGNFNMVTHDC